MKMNAMHFVPAAAMLFAGCAENGNRLPGKPNIVFILADDLGYRDLGCYGQTIIKTPNIDSIAARGIRFTQYYSGSPVSAPSRCVLLSGQHSGHAFIRGNHEWAERGDVWNYESMEKDPRLEGQFPVPASSVMYSKLLQQAGYTTACIGKWGLGAPFSEGIPSRQGFDYFFGYNCQRQAHTYYPAHLWRNEEIVKLENAFVIPRTKELDGDKDPMNPASYARYTQPDYAPELMLEETLAFLRRAAGKPFYIHYTTIIPHVPLQAPPEWVEKYREIIGDEAPYTGDKGYFPNRYPMAAYAAMVGYLDFQVGEIVKELKRLGLYENTIIFITSDNGPVTTGGAVSQFFGNSLPFNQDNDKMKGSLYEAGIRVPMIVSWPSVIREPGVNEDLLAAYDVFPTICGLAGAALPEGIDGLSFVPSITGRGNQAQHEFLYWEYPERRGQQAVRIGNWKGLRDSTKDGRMAIKLFDLSADPGEKNDLSSSHPDVVKRIEGIMSAEHVKPEIARFNIF